MSNDKTYQTPEIRGNKGKGGGNPPYEHPNTLRSKSTARIIDLLGEGEIGGLVDGMKSVYLDDTPVQNPDGSYNFEGITVYERTGTPTQSHIPGFPSVEQEVPVSTEVKNNAPIVRSVSNVEADAVRVKVRIPALFKTIKKGSKQGDMVPITVKVAVELKSTGGSWQRVTTRTISGKNTAPYEESILVHLTSEGPWQVRLVRLTDDYDDESHINAQTYWSSYTEVTYAKLTYPDFALLGIEVDAQQFGDKVPDRAYDVEGMVIKVPTNYDPNTRTYTGIWDGTFKNAISDNPAWILYDLATNSRYGAGLPNVSKFDLYDIAKYCDELVPASDGSMEPRFTVNTVISSREDAYKVLNAVASAARAKLHWATNTLITTQDKPTPPTREFSNANVVDGIFKYQGSAKKARHNVVNVVWNDPADLYRQAVERVEDPIGLREMDEIVEAEITAFGCTSRGQARRQGLWKLFTERKETDVVEFTATLEAYDMQPNEIVNVYDQDKQGIRLSGRIVYSAVNDIELDKAPDLSDGINWELIVRKPDGGYETQPVTGSTGNVLHLQNDLSVAPLDNTTWTLQASNIKPVQYRILKIAENDDHTFTITAQMHDPQKYEELEYNVQLEDDQVSFIPTGPILAPLNVTLTTYTYLAGGTSHQGLNVSWTPPDDARIRNYQVQYKSPNDVVYQDLATVTESGFDIRDIVAGEHSVRVRSVERTGRTSAWTVETTEISSLLEPLPPTSVDASIGNFNIRMRPISAAPQQEYQFWRSNAALTEEQIETNAIYLGDATVFNDDNLDFNTTYYYYIRGVNVYGTSAWYPVQYTTLFEPRTIIDVISGEIRSGDLYQSLQDRLDLIDGPASINGTVNARLAALEALSTDTDAEIQQQVDELDVTSTQNTLDISGNANAIQGLDTRVVVTENSISSISQDVTALQSSLQDSQGIQIVTANAFNSLSSTVTETENEVSGIAQNVTQLNTSVSDLDNGLTANSDAIQTLTTNVDVLDGRVNTNTSDISTLQATVNGNTASIQQKAELSTVTDLETDVTNIKAEYTVKTDVNGYISGFGLMNDGNESQFQIVADQFSVVDPNTGNSNIPFIIEDGNTYISKGIFADATIESAMIKDGAITNAKIGDYIQGEDYVPNQSGWKINKKGNIEINNLKARGNIDGSTITGSYIEGSAIVGSAFLKRTELDPGDNRYLALDTTLNWSGNINVPNNGAYHYFPPVDIYSANNTNRDQYYRFRRHRVSARVTITCEDRGADFYVRVMNGNSEVIFTGKMDQYPSTYSGTYWNAHYVRFSDTYCYRDCDGNQICNSRPGGSRVTFNLVDYPFAGNGQLRFRVYSNRWSTATATMTAYNDY